MPNTIPNKERIRMPRQHMPEAEALVRARNFQAVNLGFDPKLAGEEALRCLACAKPTCRKGCPVGIDVKEFVARIIEGDYLGAAAVIRKDNALPAITGRVCPQEEQCEGDCLIVKSKKESVAIGHLERFVADYERSVGKVGMPEIAPPTGRKVAIVGSGPAGLSCAGDLIQRGHKVHVFEAPSARPRTRSCSRRRPT
jgi:glutamate synthase (NADPH/NADH) small chain